MIHPFRDISIKHKLVVITMSTSIIVLFLASLVFVSNEIITFRHVMVKDLSILADVIGMNSTAALIFNDPKSAGETLSALKAVPNVVSASIYTKDLRLFARYSRSPKGGELPDPKEMPQEQTASSGKIEEGTFYRNGYVDLSKRIALEADTIGMVSIRSDLEEVYSRFKRYAWMAAAVIILSSLVAYFLSSALQRVISKPILRLAETMKDISEKKDYAVRVERPSGDELGTLHGGFNEMLAQIQERDEALLRAQVELEKWAKDLQRELTERQRAEAGLRESEQRFRQLAENIKELFYMSNLGMNQILYVSPAYEEIWGRPCQRLLEKKESFWDALHPEDRDRVMGSLQKRSSEEVEEQYRILRPNGSIRWIKDRSFPVRDGSGGIYRIVGIAVDITEQKLGEERLRYFSLHDSLTGLYNRTYFQEEMHRLEKGRHDPVGIVLCDVDGLKLVNDILGHTAGDVLLLAATKVIRESFREGDVVARVGGDEFSVILPGSSEPIVKKACERVQDHIKSYNATNPKIPLSISVGFAVKSGPSVKIQDTFGDADSNMYREKLHRAQSVRSAIVRTLMKTLEARNFAKPEQVRRLQNLVEQVARLIGLPERSLVDLRLLSQFHDIGKVGIPDRILLKNGPLAREEWTEMKRHCEIGYRIATSSPELAPIADWILKHHECWNGQGYPFGLRGEEIPIECRIMAIAEAYVAMTSDRCYRKALSHLEALAELWRHSGSQFDARLLDEFGHALENVRLEQQP